MYKNYFIKLNNLMLCNKQLISVNIKIFDFNLINL